MGHVYLICLERPLAHAKHYIGYVEHDIDARFARHKSGQGAKMLRACNQKGINYKITRTWSDVDRNFERKLKNNSHSKKHCPCCNGKGNIQANS